jgi:hypothetical protein
MAIGIIIVIKYLIWQSKHYIFELFHAQLGIWEEPCFYTKLPLQLLHMEGFKPIWTKWLKINNFNHLAKKQESEV